MATSPDKEPGFFQRLFSRSKSSSSPTSPNAPNNEQHVKTKKDKHHRSSSGEPTSPSSNKPKQTLAPPPGVKLQTQTSASSTGTGNRSPTAKTGSNADRKPSGSSASRGRGTGKSQRHRKRGKKSAGQVKIDSSRPLEFPATPEMILAYHKAKPFLNQNEEWLLVELNEYECLVDSLDIIKTIAKHSKFFEVEPDELWEEFFEFVDDVPSYDEVINFDVWQEFRDNKYPC